jgi:hypothetical protein
MSAHVQNIVRSLVHLAGDSRALHGSCQVMLARMCRMCMSSVESVGVRMFATIMYTHVNDSLTIGTCDKRLMRVRTYEI